MFLLGLLLFSVCKVHAFSCCSNRNGMVNQNIFLPFSLKNIERKMKSSSLPSTTTATTTMMMTKQPYLAAQSDSSKINRRGLLQKTVKMMSVLTTTMLTPSIVLAVEEEGQEQQFAYDLRDWNKNKDAIIRDDIW